MKYNRILLFVKLKVTNQFNSIVIILKLCEYVYKIIEMSKKKLEKKIYLICRAKYNEGFFYSQNGLKSIQSNNYNFKIIVN